MQMDPDMSVWKMDPHRAAADDDLDALRQMARTSGDPEGCHATVELVVDALKPWSPESHRLFPPGLLSRCAARVGSHDGSECTAAS